MQLCNKKFSFLVICAFVFFTENSVSQNSTKNVEPVKPVTQVHGIKTISMPEVPSLSIQQNGTNYYMPGKNIQPVKTPELKNQTNTQTQKQETKQNVPTSDNFLSQLNNLSASDLASLSSQGSIGTISALLEKNVNLNANAASTNFQNQNNLLDQILKELNEIKQNQKASASVDATKTKPSFEPPAILRFIVNTQDVLKSCNSVYFSNKENDGSFLLTGDCKTLLGNVNLSETFYMLFKAAGTNNGHNIYQVELSLSQVRENKNSALYKFCQQKNLTATKTGNLVTLRSNQPNLKSDILLDIGK